MEVLLLSLLVIVYIVLIAYVVLSYILGSKSLQQIAARRGIENPWLAWVPIANMWLLGCISDQYKERKYGYDPNIRQTLLVLSIVSQAGIFLLNLFSIVNNRNSVTYGSLDMVTLWLMLVVALAVLGVTIPQTIYAYKAYYDVFASCKPQFAVLFLVLSIVTPAQPFLVFACRNDDAGMAPEGYEKNIPV